MLLIGDIHIHPRHGENIIQMLRDFVDQDNNEKNIIFVGDFVYHFSYHRPSLLALLDFFLELIEQGKTVYVLAGNHDWLGQHFVYAEAERIVKSGKGKVGNKGIGDLYFITTPQIIRIESEDIFFLPYMLSRNDSEELNKYIDTMVTNYDLGVANGGSIQNSKLTLIHHYYVAERAFPGLKVKFGYKDLALSPQWLDDGRLILISGHIHHAFSYKNYLCIGAVWSTSPVEINQLQYLFTYNPTTTKTIAHHKALNPYLQVEREGGQITQDFLINQWQALIAAQKTYFVSSQFDIQMMDIDLPVDRVTLSLVSNNLQYDQLSTVCDDGVSNLLRDMKIKRKYDTLDLSIQQLTDETQNFSSGRGDWKQLLDDYLTQKFGDRKEYYEAMMKEIGI